MIAVAKMNFLMTIYTPPCEMDFYLIGTQLRQLFKKPDQMASINPLESNEMCY